MLKSTYLTLAFRHDLLVDTPLRWMQGIYENSHSPTCDQSEIRKQRYLNKTFHDRRLIEKFELQWFDKSTFSKGSRCKTHHLVFIPIILKDPIEKACGDIVSRIKTVRTSLQS
ncbi:hypothetical protein TNCV_3790441 [Trichonephila clavipes]|nr:hypothetical protein TNCV_3790441 [Trichonephila clavipes]